MAVVWVIRGAVILAPVGWKLVQQVQGSDLARWDKTWNDLIGDADVSDEEASQRLSAATGRVMSVTTFPGPFSTRRLHMIWGRDSGAGVPDDDAMCTFDFLGVSGGSPSDQWNAPQFELVEEKWDAAWNAIKQFWPTSITLRQYRWYRSGPDQEAVMGGQGRTGPPVRVIDRNLPGTSTGTVALPPQCAISVTERTSVARSWGRFYLPAPMAATSADLMVDAHGRWDEDFQNAIADAWKVAYSAVASGSLLPVVYSKAKSARPSAGGGTLPAISAHAYTVDELQVDDLADVIRSRRWSATLNRERRVI